MKAQPTVRTCPECGRTLTTTVNRWGVEMWPQHNAARLSGQGGRHYAEVAKANLGRADGFRDYEQPCFNSRTPV
jgi:hypothetical protein